jgi:raffinose/stachyose/melibiose transport system substrate-binding protein
MGNGKAAMELMGQWAPANDAANATDKKGVPLSFFPFPTVAGGAGGPSDVMGGGNGFGIGKNAPPQTLDFVRFLTSADNQRAMGKTGALVSPVKAAADGVIPQMQPVAQAIANAHYYQLYYDQFLPPTVATTVVDQTQALYAGTTTPQAAAQAIDASAASALKP